MKTLRLARVAASPARKGRMQSSNGNASATPIPRKTCRRLRSQCWESMLAIVVLRLFGGFRTDAVEHLLAVAVVHGDGSQGRVWQAPRLRLGPLVAIDRSS